MPAKRIHLIVSDLYPGDAIGNFVLSIHRELDKQKFSTYLYAERFDTEIPNVYTYAKFFSSVKLGDVLLYQLSNHDSAFPEMMDMPCRKVVYYHNITPGHFFAPYCPQTAEQLEAGRRSLGFIRRADAVLANSRFSLSEITPFLAPGTSCAVFPPFLSSCLAVEPDTDKANAPSSFRLSGTPYLLMLGRIAPHKRIEDAIAVFTCVRSQFPNLRLVIVGAPYPPYADALQCSIAIYGGEENAVVFTGKVDRGDVAVLLRHASGLLHTSAHEGFCMPLVEAMSAGIPVFAHKQEAILETLGGAGIVFDAKKPQEAAKLIVNCLSNANRRFTMLAAQKKRASSLLLEADAKKLLQLLFGGTNH